MRNVDRVWVVCVTVLVMTAVYSGLNVVLAGGRPWQDGAGMLALAVLSNGILAAVIVRGLVRSFRASRAGGRAVRKARQQEIDASLGPAARNPPRHPLKVRCEMPRRRIIPFRW
ncbi:MAG: hypothetical protein U1E05_08720 [Patescibacteria group bacterium]|nr:hypothetical protein [Patescibacteria group bacterium]